MGQIKIDKSTITKIHNQSLAEEDKVYVGNDGVTYVGTVNGRLRRTGKITDEIIEKNGKKELDSFDTYSREELIERLEQIGLNETELERLENVKADKCFALAMSIVM